MATDFKKYAWFFCALLLPTHGLHAGEPAASPSWWETKKGDLSVTWDSDRYSILIPFNTYHSRSTYDRERINEFNEMPWGLGIERFHYDEHRNRHSFYAFGFADSWNDFQPVLGYAWERNFHCGDSRFGIGYSAILTARRKQHYTPLPGVVPIASVGYKSAAVQTTWVPYLGPNNGNVFLTLFKYSI